MSLRLLRALEDEVAAQSPLFNLRNDEIVHTVASSSSFRFQKRHTFLNQLFKAFLSSKLLELIVRRLANLDFALVARPKFILNVLAAAKALENSTTHHNAHFS